MNSGNFEKWIQEKLIPNLPPRTVIVIDNASYHNIEVNRVPTSNTKVGEMKQWLAERNISYPASALKPDLYEIIKKKHKSDNEEYRLHAICAAAGHSVIRLPDLNPIEMVWGTVKNWVGQRNVTFKLDDAMRLAEEKFNSISGEDQAAYCNKVENREDQYFAREMDIDTRTDNIIITSDSEGSETSDEDDE